MIKKSLMKKRILSLFFLSGIIFPYEGPAQKVEFLDGLPSIPYDYSYRMDISPKMKIVRDTLYVATASGFHFKDLEQEKAFSPYAFQGIPVLDFVQTGQRMLVISPRISGKTDSLLLFSEDRGKSFRDLTSNLATEDKPETARGMAQNPQNPETVLLATDRGLYVSRNFGESWTRISDSNVIYPVVEFHPLDTNTVFLAGLSAESRKGIIETLDLKTGFLRCTTCRMRKIQSRTCFSTLGTRMKSGSREAGMPKSGNRRTKGRVGKSYGQSRTDRSN